MKHFLLPDLGEGLAEGKIVKWLVAVGDTVALNRPIMEVETAKAMVEIPAKWAGTLTEILAPEGTTVRVGSAIVTIDTGAESSDTALAEVEVAPGEGAVEPGLIGGPVSRLWAAEPAARRRPRAMAPGSPGPRPARALAAPPVRKLAQKLGVDLSTLSGSGPNGAITRKDVYAAKPGERRLPHREPAADSCVATHDRATRNRRQPRRWPPGRVRVMNTSSAMAPPPNRI